MSEHLALVVAGSLVAGVGIGLAASYLALGWTIPRFLGRCDRTQVLAVLEEAARQAVARHLRPRRSVRWGRWVGRQHGRHLA